MLAPWKKSHDKTKQHIKKQRHYFADKGPSSQSYDFPSSHVWMWELDHKEDWVLKNWCFWTVEDSWVSWTARRYNQSTLKEISPEYSLEGLMLKLKLQYFGHLMWRTNSFEKTLVLGKIEGRRRRVWLRTRWLDGITDSMDSMEFEQTPGDSNGQGSLPCCCLWGHKESDTTYKLNNNKDGRGTNFCSVKLLRFQCLFDTKA